jgi:hypothetical protein
VAGQEIQSLLMRFGQRLALGRGQGGGGKEHRHDQRRQRSHGGATPAAGISLAQRADIVSARANVLP